MGEVVFLLVCKDGLFVGIGMLECNYMGVCVVVISWDFKDDIRLYVEVIFVVIVIDFGFEYFCFYRCSELWFGDNLFWYCIGGFMFEGLEEGS